MYHVVPLVRWIVWIGSMVIVVVDWHAALFGNTSCLATFVTCFLALSFSFAVESHCCCWGWPFAFSFAAVVVEALSSFDRVYLSKCSLAAEAFAIALVVVSFVLSLTFSFLSFSFAGLSFPNGSYVQWCWSLILAKSSWAVVLQLLLHPRKRNCCTMVLDDAVADFGVASDVGG